MRFSTVRSAFDPTFGEPPCGSQAATLQQLINSQWIQTGRADLVAALRRHPVLLRDRSMLLNLAIEEYKAKRQSSEHFDLDQHCRRFQEFGSSIQRSILRQLETQRYIDAHPELLDALCAPTWPVAGEDFGSFHVLEELGIGAMARVYLCRQTDVGDRRVVVKVTPFSNFEASILGRLDHPNIIPIYSTGTVEALDLYYLCMPYCGRSTLTDLIDLAFQYGCPRLDAPITAAAARWVVGAERPAQRGRLGLPIRLGYRSYVDGMLILSIQVAEALEHAHQQRILHGDLKPSNVLLTPNGRPLLLDFNLSQDLNSTAMCGGTLPYMPPEHLWQVVGRESPQQTSTLDVTSDIYSFGALLYELLTGVTPVAVTADVADAPTMAKLLLARLKHGIPPARQRNPLVSPRLESVVLSCLAFDPRDRPRSIIDVKQQLLAEVRSPAAIVRTARVQPFFFSAIVGIPLSLAVATVAHFAVQPARDVADYEQGLRLATSGNSDEAIDYFASAVGANPSFAAARFQLARARLARGEIDFAINDFGQLARIDNDPHSMAYLGYCFNLKGLTSASIPWYERALESGAKTIAIYNNLGASYLDARTQHSYEEQLRRAENALRNALELDAKSITVQLNLVRHAVAKSEADRSFNPYIVWRQAAAILSIAQNDSFFRSNVLAWYDVSRDYKQINEDTRQHSNAATSETDSAIAEIPFEFHRAIRRLKQDVANQDSSPPSVADRCFLEPL